MTPRGRLVALTAALLVVLALGARGTVRYAALLRDLAQRTSSRLSLLAQAEAATRGAFALKDSLRSALLALEALGPGLMEGRTPMEASAALSGLVNLLAAHNRVRLTRVDHLPDSSPAFFQPVSLSVSAEGDLAGLAGILRDIEKSRQLLLLKDLTIQAPDPGAPSQRPELLLLDLTISAYYIPRERNQ
jgi:hypothetical protein